MKPIAALVRRIRAVAHGKFGDKQPAATGNPDFERVFRAVHGQIAARNFAALRIDSGV